VKNVLNITIYPIEQITVDLRLSAATQMMASLVDRIHIACFGEEMHQLAIGLLP